MIEFIDNEADESGNSEYAECYCMWAEGPQGPHNGSWLPATAVLAVVDALGQRKAASPTLRPLRCSDALRLMDVLSRRATAIRRYPVAVEVRTDIIMRRQNIDYPRTFFLRQFHPCGEKPCVEGITLNHGDVVKPVFDIAGYGLCVKFSAPAPLARCNEHAVVIIVKWHEIPFLPSTSYLF
jgi:hypothetical protein